MGEITSLVTSVGFPIAMCLIMGYWIKTTHDDHREDIQKLQENHTKETSAMTDALNNNTLALQQLIDRKGDNNNVN